MGRGRLGAGPGLRYAVSAGGKLREIAHSPEYERAAQGNGEVCLPARGNDVTEDFGRVYFVFYRGIKRYPGRVSVGIERGERLEDRTAFKPQIFRAAVYPQFENKRANGFFLVGKI